MRLQVPHSSTKFQNKEVPTLAKNKIDWSPKELKAIELLASPQKMTQEEIAAECGIDRKTLWNWRQQDDFIQAVNDLAYQGLKARLPDVYEALLLKAQEGNTKAIELTLKFADRFIERSQVSIDGDLQINIDIKED